MMKFAVVDTMTNTILSFYNNQFEGPISQVKLFYLNQHVDYPEFINDAIEQSELERNEFRETRSVDQVHLVVTSTLQMSAVYMNVIDSGLDNRYNLDESENYDASLCVCPADIDMDGQKEIVIGTYAQELLMYKYTEDRWTLQMCRSLEHPIHSLEYIDVTGDGVKELIVLTLGGLHVMQHSQDVMYNKFMTRLKQIVSSKDVKDIKKAFELSEPFD